MAKGPDTLIRNVPTGKSPSLCSLTTSPALQRNSDPSPPPGPTHMTSTVSFRLLRIRTDRLIGRPSRPYLCQQPMLSVHQHVLRARQNPVHGYHSRTRARPEVTCSACLRRVRSRSMVRSRNGSYTGALRMRVGASMAMKQAPNIGKSIVTFAVISTTRTMPVSGARTTPTKKAAIPTTANPSG